MMDLFDDDIADRIVNAEARYGPFTSTHEAMGVISEEWDELRAAVHANALESVWHEALDIAAACIRLARQIDAREPGLIARSVK
jgi:hypothetical protein